MRTISIMISIKELAVEIAVVLKLLPHHMIKHLLHFFFTFFVFLFIVLPYYHYQFSSFSTEEHISIKNNQNPTYLWKKKKKASMHKARSGGCADVFVLFVFSLMLSSLFNAEQKEKKKENVKKKIVPKAFELPKWFICNCRVT